MSRSALSLKCAMVAILFMGIAVSVASGEPIIVENSGSTSEFSNTTTGSLTGFTVGNNANRMLLVAVGGEVSEVTSVSYGGTPLTMLANVDQSTAGGPSGPSTASIWGLDSPAVGTADIDVSIGGIDNSFLIGALSLTSDGEMSVVATDTAGGSGGANPATLTFSPLDVADDYFMLSVAERNNNGSLTPPGGLMELFADTNLSGSATVRSDFAFFSDTSTNSFDWNFSTRHALAGVAIQAARVPEPTSIALWIALGCIGCAVAYFGARGRAK